LLAREHGDVKKMVRNADFGVVVAPLEKVAPPWDLMRCPAAAM
jgi:hypothetical protein